MAKSKNSPVDVAILVPNRSGSVPTEIAMSWAALEGFTKDVKPHVKMRWAGNSVYYIDEARWELARLACERNVDYVFFIDADMLLPPYALAALLDLNTDFATGLGFTNDKDRPIPSWYHYIPEHQRRNNEMGTERRCWAPLLFYHRAPPEFKTFSLDGCGMYAALIKADVFHRIAEANNSLLEWYNPFKRNGAGEDLSFCWRTMQLGIKVIGHRDVVCDHISRERQLINEGLYLKQFSPDDYDCYSIHGEDIAEETPDGAHVPSVPPALSSLA